MSGPSRVAAISVGSNSLLIILKLIVGLVTGSVSILAEAIHSSIDLLAAVIAFFGLRAAGKPADHEHQFGHGKWENVSGSVEAVLIFIAAIWIIFEAVKKILHGVEVELLGWGIAVMAVSVLGGALGILMMIPLRRAFIVKQHGTLRYPEGTACAGNEHVHVRSPISGIGSPIPWMAKSA